MVKKNALPAMVQANIDAAIVMVLVNVQIVMVMELKPVTDAMVTVNLIVGLVTEQDSVPIVMGLEGMTMDTEQSCADVVKVLVNALHAMEEIIIFIVLYAMVTVTFLVVNVTVQESVIHAEDTEMFGVKLAVVREYVANAMDTVK